MAPRDHPLRLGRPRRPAATLIARLAPAGPVLAPAGPVLALLPRLRRRPIFRLLWALSALFAGLIRLIRLLADVLRLTTHDSPLEPIL
jgi:hypothetical protein